MDKVPEKILADTSLHSMLIAQIAQMGFLIAQARVPVEKKLLEGMRNQFWLLSQQVYARLDGIAAASESVEDYRAAAPVGYQGMQMMYCAPDVDVHVYAPNSDLCVCGRQRKVRHKHG